MDAVVSGPGRPSERVGIAARLWEASRIEFSQRGFHGARVQGIARRAACNVALLYRHWASKKALYQEVLASSWKAVLGEVVVLLEQGQGAPGVVSAFLDANLRDPVGAQILIREVLDGGPFLSQLAQSDPAVAEPIRRTARALAAGTAGPIATLRPGVDATVALLSIGGLAALLASAREASRPFLTSPISTDEWRAQAYGLLLNGVLDRNLAGATS